MGTYEISQNKFSSKRLAMLIKRDITSNNRQLRWQLVVVAAVIIAVELLICTSSYDNWRTRDIFYGSSFTDPAFMGLVFAFIAVGLCIISAFSATTFSVMRTKAGKINQLMSVGTTAEKYLSRLIIYAIAPAVIYLAMVCLVDMVRCLIIDTVMPVKAHFILAGLFKNETAVKGILLFSLFSAGLSAFYMTVSAFWPKRSFLKGVCIMIALQTIAVWLLDKFVSFLIPWEAHLDLAYWCAVIGLIVLTAGFVTASYFKYKEAEL